MATPKNHGNPWTQGDVEKLELGLKECTPTRGLKHRHTPEAVQAKANYLGLLSIKPTDQSPYGTGGKKRR